MTETKQNPVQWHPPGAITVKHPKGFGLVFVKDGTWAIAYKPKAGKRAWNYSFKTPAQCEAYVLSWFDALTKTAEAKTSRAAERSKAHSFKVGDIIYNSWGYDQTNIDFYQRHFRHDSTPSMRGGANLPIIRKNEFGFGVVLRTTGAFSVSVEAFSYEHA